MSTLARFAPPLQEAIVSGLGWAGLRPVQERAGAALLDGHNALILAPTASGKTEAFILPTLSLLLEQRPRGVGALYIAPSKALLNNQASRLGQYAALVGLDRFVWHGDTSRSHKRRFLRSPCALLMTTPESLEVMLISSRTPAATLFRELRVVGVDEIHALVGTDRGAHLLSVLERVARLTSNDVQRVGLSATVGNPQDILHWLQGTSKRRGQVVCVPKPKMKPELKVLMHPTVVEGVAEAALEVAGRKSLFFCESRGHTEVVAEHLRDQGLNVFVHHSSVSRSDRAQAERSFCEGQHACITCTSTLELGIDVGDLHKVLQANAPVTVSSFLQRMGRTGRRAGTVANTSFYVDNLAIGMQAIALIELARAGFVESVAMNRRRWPVMVQQLLALSLQFGAIRSDVAFRQLSQVADLSGITRKEFDKLIAHLVEARYLTETRRYLAIGSRTEHDYGRRNFMELYAVFSSPVVYRVLTRQRQVLGTLERDFVESLAPDTCFLLGGRAWVVDHIDRSKLTVRVEPAPRGKQPSWGSHLPRLLSFELSQRIRRVLEEDTQYPYVQPTMLALLDAHRAEMREALAREPLSFSVVPGKAQCWTFAGGRINQTLRHIFAVLGGFKVSADNFQVQLEGKGVTGVAIEDILRRIRTEAFWQDGDVWSRIVAALPNYCLSKFQRTLPLEYSKELVCNYLLDRASTRAFVGATSHRVVPEADNMPKRWNSRRRQVYRLRELGSASRLTQEHDGPPAQLGASHLQGAEVDMHHE